MPIPALDVDLAKPPHERWRGLARHATEARSLLASHLSDLGSIADQRELLVAYRDAVVEPEYAEELQAIAAILDVPEPDVLLANFYYDALKVALGCTAFAVESSAGPLHGRNLDWASPGRQLARSTLVLNYHHDGELRYRVIGWPGHIGALSGLRPGAFSITLNAVLSADEPQILPPVSLLLRTVLAEATDFTTALSRLEHAPIASDCLLLVAGARPREMAVVERTPTRAAVRTSTEGLLVVTNDYRNLQVAGASAAGTPAAGAAAPLAETSCGRFDGVTELLRARTPESPDDCRRILGDPGVRMNMTMQSMAFRAATAELTVWTPEG